MGDLLAGSAQGSMGLEGAGMGLALGDALAGWQAT